VRLAVVRLNDRLDDRQAEAGPAGPATSPSLGAPEAIEHPVPGVGRQTGPVVADLKHRSITFASDADLDRGLRGGVNHRVAGLACTLDELASEDAAFCADTGTPCIWTARYITAKRERHIFTGIRLEEPGDVPDSVTRLLSTPGPALLDAVVDPHALSLPPHITFGEAEGFSLSLAKQALHGNLDEVIETVKRNVRIV